MGAQNCADCDLTMVVGNFGWNVMNRGLCHWITLFNQSCKIIGLDSACPGQITVRPPQYAPAPRKWNSHPERHGDLDFGHFHLGTGAGCGLNGDFGGKSQIYVRSITSNRIDSPRAKSESITIIPLSFVCFDIRQHMVLCALILAASWFTNVARNFHTCSLTPLWNLARDLVLKKTI